MGHLQPKAGRTVSITASFPAMQPSSNPRLSRSASARPTTVHLYSLPGGSKVPHDITTWTAHDVRCFLKSLNYDATPFRYTPGRELLLLTRKQLREMLVDGDELDIKLVIDYMRDIDPHHPPRAAEEGPSIWHSVERTLRSFFAPAQEPARAAPTEIREHSS
ncbi:hypothetical protein PAPYR_4570 [Paratrimastix pyriformis]|uniref:SAM domain-containing protein n=1 Tax=Paratrimastix pyriformis TaxID=342808 RepID=A0ABQ8UMJ8_9EUKA|nr:hypothetical protein PAPYR_4570 [Paratrimastix pyriformis]